MQYRGRCHCGKLTVSFDTDEEPSELEVRACQCSFCRKHNTLTIADPRGHVSIKISDEEALSRYSFGLSTAEYLICRNCGVYVAAVTAGLPKRALVVLNCLDDLAQFNSEPIPMNYDAETADVRTTRRHTRWTPVA